MNDSIKLANLWSDLKTVKDMLDNRIMPIAGHLGIEDEDLMVAIEDLSLKIQYHFDKFKLIAVMNKK